MAKKRKTVKPQREFTRRQLSQFQRHRRRQRLIFFSGIAVIAAVVLIVAAGWFLGEYIPLHRTAIQVNDTEFSMGYYIDALRVSGQGQAEENLPGLANGLVVNIEQSELIRQAALGLGISVSDDDVRAQLQEGVKTNAAMLDIVRSQLLNQRLLEEYFTTRVPEAAAQARLNAMLLESEGQAAAMRARLQGSDNFSALAGEFSLDSYTRSTQGALDWHPQDILAVLLGSSVPGDYAFGSPAGTLSQPRYDAEKDKPVGYWLVRVVEIYRENDEAQVQALLLGSEDEARAVLARLNAGEALASLATEYSQYEESQKQEGELGIVGQGQTSPVVDEYIFGEATEAGAWSQPLRDDTVTTRGGYWLVEVLERDDARTLAAADRNYLLQQAYSDWVNLLWADPDAIIDDSYLDTEAKAWALERVTRQLKAQG